MAIAAAKEAATKETQEEESEIDAATTKILESHLPGIARWEEEFGDRKLERLESLLSTLDVGAGSESVSDDPPAVSPIGFLDTYQQYYYHLGTFLGPPIEHVWVAPGSEVSLVEVNSVKEYRFAESEATSEFFEEATTEQSTSSEFATQSERESGNQLSAGFSASGGVNFAVFHASATATLDYTTNLRQSASDARKRAVETSSRATQRIKTSRRRLVRESTETKSESTKRHTISNPSGTLRSYALKRKMQVVGIQLRHVGTRLAWQLYLDEPGLDLGLAELVHVSRPPELSLPGAQLTPPTFESIQNEYVFTVPFKAIGDADHNDDFENGAGDGRIQHVFHFEASPPKTGYHLATVAETHYERTDPDHDRPSLWSTRYDVTDAAAGKFSITLNLVNFEKQPAVKVTVRFFWVISAAQRKEALKDYRERIQNQEIERERDLQEYVVTALRDRVELARGVRPRLTDDLRTEERAVLLRSTISRLYDLQDLESPGRSAVPLHALSEHINSLFDVEGILYYVAPDWWNPRLDRSRGGLTAPELLGKSGTSQDTALYLGEANRVVFGRDAARRENNYLITERSEPAAAGSSIGWLLQLDGDLHRNAFLNSAWVKVVVPIRRGMEAEAIEWLEHTGVEGADGLSRPLSGGPDSEGLSTTKTVRQAILDFVGEFRTPDEILVSGQTYYEDGFSPLGKSFPDPQQLKIVAEWTEIVPTNQVVPVKSHH